MLFGGLQANHVELPRAAYLEGPWRRARRPWGRRAAAPRLRLRYGRLVHDGFIFYFCWFASLQTRSMQQLEHARLGSAPGHPALLEH